MNEIEAATSAKALYLQAACLAGLGVSSESPERLALIVQRGFSLIEEERRPEAVANLLKLVGETLLDAQKKGDNSLGETNVMAAQEKTCPVFPFDEFLD